MACNNRTLTIGSIIIEEHPASESNFYLWLNPSETLSGGDINESDTDRQGGHGISTSIAYNGGREMPLEIEIHATSRSQLVTMENNLRNQLALPAAPSFDGEDGFQLVTILDEDEVEKQVYARIFRRKVEMDMLEDIRQRRRRASFTLRAIDPNLYATTVSSSTGPESYETTGFIFHEGDNPIFQENSNPVFQESLGGTITVINSGTTGTPPTFTITGPTTNPVITNTTTGDKMEFSRGGGVALASGETLVINVAAATALKNGTTNVRANLSLDSAWIYLSPGSNVMSFIDDTTDDLTGQLQIQFRSAFD